MQKSNDSHPSARGIGDCSATGIGEVPGTCTEATGHPAEDAELTALVTLAELGSMTPRFLYDAFRRLGRKRSGRDPEGAVRAFRRAMDAAMAVGAEKAKETNKRGQVVGGKKADIFLVKAARSIWREAAALPLHLPNDLYGSLDAIRAASHLAPETWPRSLPAQAYALGSVEDECLDLFWLALAGGTAAPIPTGRMFLCWSLVRIGAALAGVGGEQASAFLYRALYWNIDRRLESRLTLVEAARAATCLPQGQREPLLLMILHEAERELLGVREAASHVNCEAPHVGQSYVPPAPMAATLEAAEKAADVSWVAPLLVRERADDGLGAARRLYGADAAGDELVKEMSRLSRWDMSRTKTCRMALGEPQDNHLAWVETRTNYLAWLYQKVICPATAHRIISTSSVPMAAGVGHLDESA